MRRILLSEAMAILGVAIANTYLLVSPHEPVSAYAAWLASLTLWVLAIPLFVFMGSLRRRATIPFFVVASILYTVYYALPAFGSAPLFKGFVFTQAWNSVDEALQLVFLGAICMMLGAFGFRRQVAKLPSIRREIDLPRALPTLILVSALSFAVRIAIIGLATRTFGSLLYASNAIGQIALGALIVAWLRGHLVWWHKIYCSSLVGILLVVGIASTLLSNAAIPMAALVFIYGWERRAFPWHAIFSLLLLLYPLNANKGRFRNTHDGWLSDRYEVSKVADLFTDYMSTTAVALSEGDIGTHEMEESEESRFNLLGMLSIVVSETPREIPYWEGYTYSDLVWHFIPRVIVPDKPSPPIGQEFPRRYEFLSYYNYDTSVNLSQLIELYINFGPMGVGLGMFVIGLLYACLDHIFSASSGGAFIGAVVFSGLMNIESNFSLVFGGLPLLVLIYYASIRLLPVLSPSARTDTDSASSQSC